MDDLVNLIYEALTNPSYQGECLEFLSGCLYGIIVRNMNSIMVDNRGDQWDGA